MVLKRLALRKALHYGVQTCIKGKAVVMFTAAWYGSFPLPLPLPLSPLPSLGKGGGREGKGRVGLCRFGVFLDVLCLILYFRCPLCNNIKPTLCEKSLVRIKKVDYKKIASLLR